MDLDSEGPEAAELQPEAAEPGGEGPVPAPLRHPGGQIPGGYVLPVSTACGPGAPGDGAELTR